MTSGTWTHDYPITYERAQELGLPVRSDMPENMLLDATLSTAHPPAAFGRVRATSVSLKPARSAR